MRLYHFTKDKHAIKNIENRRLKISLANDVNDLFELKPFDFGSRKVRLGWPGCIDNYVKEQGFISFTSHWLAPTMWAHYADLTNAHSSIRT